MDEFIKFFKKIIREAVSESFQEEFCKFDIVTKTESPSLSEELLDIKQVRLLLKISKPTVYKMMKNKKLPYRRAGRRLLFPKMEVLQALNNTSKK